ncbi:hypothetical protein D9M73_82550 [compost metagenome]
MFLGGVGHGLVRAGAVQALGLQAGGVAAHAFAELAGVETDLLALRRAGGGCALYVVFGVSRLPYILPISQYSLVCAIHISAAVGGISCGGGSGGG